jgi:transcription initiation factor TFIIA large subunit
VRFILSHVLDGKISLSSLSSDEMSDDDEAMEQTEHQIVCAFESVKRTKNKWKFVLRNGVMHIDGEDYLFNKMLGDGEW